MFRTQARAQNLDPLEQGPLGQVRDASDTQGAYGALMPAQPLVGGAPQIGQAVGAIAAQDPVVAAALVRQWFADKADFAMKRTQNGDNAYGGVSYANAIDDTQNAHMLSALPIGTPALRQVRRRTTC